MNFLKRLIIAVVFIPLLLWVYYTGEVWLLALLGLITLLCTYELMKMFEKKNIALITQPPNSNTNNPTEVATPTGQMSNVRCQLSTINLPLSLALFYSIARNPELSVPLIFLVLLLNGVRNVLFSDIQNATARISGELFVVCYPAIGFGLLFRLTAHHPTIVPILAVLIWIVDTFAYFIGMTMGRHRGIFKCSPKKSIEGFIAGIVFAFIGSFIVLKIFPDIYTIKHIIYLTISAGIFGQLGDLYESVIKRDMGVKDSSQMIPGHGGVLDRFDSLLIAAPILFILLNFF